MSMTATEALAVLRKVLAYQPNQRVDDLTPDAWAEALAPHFYTDAVEAVRRLATAPRSPYKPPFIDVGDVVAECRAAERRRVEERWRRAQLSRPSGLDPAADVAWERSTRAALRDPSWAPPKQLEGRQTGAEPVSGTLLPRLRAIRARKDRP